MYTYVQGLRGFSKSMFARTIWESCPVSGLGSTVRFVPLRDTFQDVKVSESRVFRKQAKFAANSPFHENIAYLLSLPQKPYTLKQALYASPDIPSNLGLVEVGEQQVLLFMECRT